jgi:predicted phage terminase large subunit-like protein
MYTVTPALFAQYCSRFKWVAYDYLLMLSDELIKVARGETKHLMIFMPPRHGKSELTSKYFPAWFLGHFPDKRVMLTSYEADFAASWGYKARNILDENGHLFGLKVSGASAARNRWDIEGHDGGMVTAGVGGPITGRGAHLLIIDDPVKNAEDANSKTMRDKAAEWYKSTAYTRLEPGGAVIIIQTRWHEDDLSGRLLKEEPDKWKVISLPALAEENDPMGRTLGQPLSPHRYNIEALQEIKSTIGSYWFNSLYQQHPQPVEGAIFKRPHFKYCTLSDGLFDLGTKKVKYNDCRIFQTCDPAASTKTTADYFVLSTWAQTPDNDLILLDVLRTRLEGPDQIPLFKQQHRRWNPVFQAVEAVGIGKTLYQMLVHEGLPVRELRADSDKVTRALPAAARMEAGAIYFMAGAPWLADFEQELLSFPTGAHDDQVDTLSYAVQMIVKKQIGNFDLSALIRTKAR